MNTTKPIVRYIDRCTRLNHLITDYAFEISQGEKRRLIAVGITDKAMTLARNLTSEERIRAAKQFLLKLQGEGEDLFAGTGTLYVNMLDSAFHRFAENGRFE